jgi:2'-5' RNA ligase
MSVIAINVLLDPDAVTVEKAQAANARLREDYPHGFALDANHAPHITILQRFVRTADLDEVAKAVAEVLRTEQLMKWQSKAIGYYALADKDLRLVGIVIEPTEDLRRLQQRIIAAVAPFVVEQGTGEAFAPRPDGEPISQPTVDYVNNFVGPRTGMNYHPHLTVGIGIRDCVDALIAELFETFTFRAVSVSLYQVGDYGVAQRKLYDLHCIDPLPSWNDGPAKQGILAFIATVTKDLS